MNDTLLEQRMFFRMFTIMIMPHPVKFRKEGKNTEVREKTALSYRSFTF